MAYAPKKVCPFPGCNLLIDDHKKACAMHARGDVPRDDEDRQRFYKSRRWRIVRARQLKKEPLCRECKENGSHTWAAEVDHIVPIRAGGAKVDPDNLQSLCGKHHRQKTARERLLYPND